MIKRSLTAKLFFFVLVLFMVQLFIQYGFQTFFLVDYYENQKIELARNQFDEAITAFAEADGIIGQSDVLYSYMDITDEPILVFTDYLDLHPASMATTYEQSVYVKSEDDIFLLPYFNFETTIGLETGLDLEAVTTTSATTIDSIGSKVYLEGYMDGEEFVPINYYNETDFLEINNYTDFDSSIIREGVIADFGQTYPKPEMNKKISDLSNYFYVTYVDGTSELSDAYNYFEKVEYVKGKKYIFLTTLSLQPINEVLEIQSTFQFYLMLIMIGLIIIVSFIFSRVISKPIVNISASTGEIANLNFDATCDESRHDEIGKLGRSINRLSMSLKDKIDTLEDEIEFERRQEKIRREFVADVSHELKTPLGVIRSYSEGIKDGISKEKADYYLNVIIEEVDKMNGLVLDMLELSNLESGKLIEKEHINMKRLIENLLRAYDQLIPNMHVTVDLDDLMVDVDVKKMELVISNILSNAFRYVDERNIINISLKDGELRIENSHEAISEDDLNKLWDRFYRVEKSRSRDLGGNGLGLSIVQKTLELHGLESTIENSEVGFLFKLGF